VTLAGYSRDGINVFRSVLKLRNESQLVLRPKGKLFQTRGAATEKRRLPNNYSEVQLTVHVITSSAKVKVKVRYLYSAAAR